MSSEEIPRFVIVVAYMQIKGDRARLTMDVLIQYMGGKLQTAQGIG